MYINKLINNFEPKNNNKTIIINKKEINNSNIGQKLEIDKISYKEMEEDFSKLKEKEEIRKAENELLFLIRRSTKDNSQEEKENDTKKVKRPKNPFVENLE